MYFTNIYSLKITMIRVWIMIRITLNYQDKCIILINIAVPSSICRVGLGQGILSSGQAV